jgi:hypothetical protein
MVNAAAWALAEGIADSADDVDLATVLGLGFPPSRGGFARFAETAGVGSIVRRLEEAAERYGPRSPPRICSAAWRGITLASPVPRLRTRGAATLREPANCRVLPKTPDRAGGISQSQRSGEWSDGESNPDLLNAIQPSETDKTGTNASEGVGFVCAQCGGIPAEPELQAVVDAWTRLSTHVRWTILDVVRRHMRV